MGLESLECCEYDLEGLVKDPVKGLTQILELDYEVLGDLIEDLEWWLENLEDEEIPTANKVFAESLISAARKRRAQLA